MCILQTIQINVRSASRLWHRLNCHRTIIRALKVFEQHGTRYPDVKGASRKYRLLENIILFLSIVGQIVLTTVDYMTDNEINWSFIVLLVVIYANVTLRLAIVGRNGYILKL